MPAEYTQGDQFRGARIHLCDLSGLEIRDCDVTGLKIVDCYGGNVSLGGGFERVVVNDVDVTAYVEAELDRLHPNRVLGREPTSEAELDRVCGRKPADLYPDKDYVVRRCLSVVLKEEAEHHRYAVRDLTVLEADTRTE
ncbi:hypothetical protein [Actinomadura sp. 6N118]|uniref:hypothetical protein n=1 Tax=Actinomadura sp. 6N118 TaxID=3375151 RepID=UPI0037BDB0F7